MTNRIRSRVFDAAAKGAPEISPLIQYILDRLDGLKSEGANEGGQVFDFVHGYDKIRKIVTKHEITGFFKHPAVGEAEPSNAVFFPAISFTVTEEGDEAFIHMFYGQRVNRNVPEIEQTQVGPDRGNPHIEGFDWQQKIDYYISEFVRERMTGHPARARIFAANSAALTPPGKQPPAMQPVTSLQTPEA